MFDTTKEEELRRKKADAMRDMGINPFPPRSKRTHTAIEAKAAFETGGLGEKEEVSLVGRVRAIRVMGKASFAHIEDGSGPVQIYLRKDDLGEEAYTFFRRMIDVGDFIGVTGYMFRTRTGEITCHVKSLELLTKTYHPLPDKWHGLKDVETRYRHRYVDLLMSEEVRKIFVTRAKLVQALREYLDSNGFLEVETPILQPIYGGAAARPFITHHNQLHQDLYLRISFELYLKRLIVGGYERVYEIGRDFRNEGVSYKHNPEFTQLEFYEAYTDYRGVMKRAEEMVAYAAEKVLGTLEITFEGHEIDLTPPWRRLPLRDAIREASGIDYEEYPTAESLGEAMREKGATVNPKASRAKLIDNLIGTFVEPNLIQPTFLVDYPVEMSPLAKRSPVNPNVAERFEGFIGGIELCNAFSELNDPGDQLQRFQEQARARAAGDEEATPVDEDFVLALRFGMPPTGGFGMGIDRFTMVMTDKPSIREVILFPHLRSREK